MSRHPECQTHEEVMFYDTDAGGVVHNIAYLRFVEKARTLLGGKLGLSLKQMSESGLYAVVTRTEIDYIKPALLGDQLTIEGRLEGVGRVRFSCAFEIYRDSDRARMVTCRQELAMVQMPEGRPARLPEQFKKFRE
ncbi:MAG: thioesterase family protein [Verrucomicrobiota bacterium]|nr:thioesterase family protein [Verrucomicrobiota bacterium]